MIVQWNVLEHFWPYWDAVQVPWLAQLDVSLTAALADRTIDDHVATLKRLNVAAPDGHTVIICPGEARRSFVPFAADWIEDRAVITTSATPLLLPGDVILAIDDQPIAQRLAAEEAVVSGSPQWRRTIAASHLNRDTVSTPAALKIQRGERVLQVQVPRVDREVEDANPHAMVERLPDGVYYVDLERAERSDLTAVMDRLADAPGVVFDLRIGPNDHEWLSHVLTRPDTANAWLAVPRILRPDHPASVHWDTSGWSLPVAAPHLRGRIAFLSGPRARSYPESVLGLVEHYHLGPIVGGPSAGANGDIAVVGEPTGCTMQFTGRRVTKLDGSRQYLVGFAPTIPAAPTIAGVAAGRDEVLERALAYVRTGQ